MTAALGVSISATRQQLAILQGEGLVVPRAHRQGPGRPSHTYHLTELAEEAFVKHYDTIALEMIDDLVELDGEAKLEALLEKRSARFLAEFEGALEGLDVDDKLKMIADRQERCGYMATHEKSGELTEFNCPHIEVSRKYPQFCESERKTYEKLIGKKVSMTRCQAKGGRACTFSVDE